MLKRHIPLLLMLAFLGSIGALVLYSQRTPPQPPAPPPPDPKTTATYCYVEGAKVEPGGKMTLRFHASNSSFTDINAPGTLDLDVVHTEGFKRSDAEKAAKPTPDTTSVCSWKADVPATAYDSEHVATLTGTFDKPCPNVAMPGRFVIFRSGLKQGDGLAICDSSGQIPAALGGEDKTSEQLEGEMHRRAAQVSAPQELASIRDYLATLPRAAAAIDPTHAPKESYCGAAVSGDAPLFLYSRLRSLATSAARDLDVGVVDAGVVDAGVVDAGLVDAGEPLVSFVPRGLALQSVLASALDDAYDSPAPRIKEIGTQVKTLGDFIVVHLPLEYVAPVVEMPDITPSQREGRFTSGRYKGAVIVVDRIKGKIACAATYSGVNEMSEVKSQEVNELRRMVDADLAGSAAKAGGSAFQHIAPGLHVVASEIP